MNEQKIDTIELENMPVVEGIKFLRVLKSAEYKTSFASVVCEIDGHEEGLGIDFVGFCPMNAPLDFAQPDDWHDLTKVVREAILDQVSKFYEANPRRYKTAQVHVCLQPPA